MTSEKFKKLRKSIGSQHYVANALNVSQGQISIWEMGYKPVPEEIINRLIELSEKNK